MKKQTRLALLLCTIVVILAVGYALIFALSRRPYGAVRMGMTPDQVRKLLGKPKSTDLPLSLRRRPDEINSYTPVAWSMEGYLWSEEWDDILETVTITYLNGRVTDITRLEWKEKVASYSPWWRPF
jgi:hypothetical protein